MAFTVPPPLEPGSEVAVLAPAATPEGGARPDHLVDLGLERLAEAFDLAPVEYPSLRQSREYRYDHPGERAAELAEAFRDPDVDGVIAAIGGNDQVRVLGHLDPAVFREHSTRFFGTSDNTCVASFLWEQGVASFYGGTLFTDVAEPGGINDYTREYLRRAFFEESLGDLHEADEFTDHDLDWTDPANLDRDPEYEPAPGWTWAGGGERIEGRTWGGCLAVLDTLLAADRVPTLDRLDGAVLLIETSEELPAESEVRRTLLAMGERGLLGRVDAVLVGRAKARSHLAERPPEERRAYRERQRAAVVDVVGEYNPDAPVVLDLPFGHTKPVAPVPVGGRVVVDPERERIAFP